MRRRDVLILVQAAIAHAHSETIHPLADGNGRTDRALVHVMLRGRGLTTIAALPTSPGGGGISKPIFGELEAYRSGLAERIIGLFAKAALDSVARGSGWQLNWTLCVTSGISVFTQCGLVTPRRTKASWR